MRLMLLTALAVWIGFNLLFVAWMHWRGAPRRVRGNHHQTTPLRLAWMV